MTPGALREANGGKADWCLVHSKTGRELLAQSNLRRQGFRTFLPLTYRTIRHARRIRTTVCAYFPGYLFVELNLGAQEWRCINSTVGVLRLVTSWERPRPAPRNLVDALRAATDQRGILDLSSTVEPGDVVRLSQGPFSGQLGVVQTLSGPDRVKVLLTIMNATVPVEISRDACALA